MKKTILLFALIGTMTIHGLMAQSGTTGTLTWEITDSTLTISGSGTMLNYTSSSAPWSSYLTAIATAIIGDSVTSIGNYAFYGCNRLTSINIPNSVTSIGDAAFSGCSGLSSITIPNSVTNIGNNTFQNCSSLTAITISNSVTSIGSYAFSGCSGLSFITIPNSVTNIGNNTFQNCTVLTTVNFNADSCIIMGNYSTSC